MRRPLGAGGSVTGPDRQGGPDGQDPAIRTADPEGHFRTCHAPYDGRSGTPRPSEELPRRYLFFGQEFSFIGPGRELGAVMESQLGQDVVHMNVDGPDREVQLPGDVAVGEAAGHQRGDL